VLATRDDSDPDSVTRYEKSVSNIKEVKARDGIVISIVTVGDRLAREASDHIIELPPAPNCCSIARNHPLQLLAYHIAVRLGCDVDQPRKPGQIGHRRVAAQGSFRDFLLLNSAHGQRPRIKRTAVFSIFFRPYSFLCARAHSRRANSPLRQIHTQATKRFTEEQVASLTGLQLASEVSRDDLQGAADRLVNTGLFANVKYTFQSRPDGVVSHFRWRKPAPSCFL